jgi:glycosyltransferase involved in cell wall biosynthesis
VSAALLRPLLEETGAFVPEPVDHPIRLSVVIPAYNEAQRLPLTLAKIDAYLSGLGGGTEIVLVDDGSSDATADIASAFQPLSARIQVLRLPHRGKAAAVRAGVLAAEGSIVLFTDADLSTPIDYAGALIEAIDSGADVAIGSRQGALARRHDEPLYRHLMGRVFNLVVRLVALPGIEDTQCGFKAFRHAAGQDIFSHTRLHIEPQRVRGPRVTAFDVEVLVLARRAGYRIVEIPVVWTHAPGSKVSPLLDSIRMLVDVLTVRVNTWRGLYDQRPESCRPEE